MVFAQSLAQLFAETSWPDVGRDFVALLYMTVSSYFIYLARRDAGKAKTAADATGVKLDTVGATVDTVNTKVDTVTEKTTRAAVLAKTAAQVAVASDKKADARGDLLAKVAEHTNGEYAALKAERDELRKWKEGVLAAQPPPAAVEAIMHVAETVDAVADKVGAPKSGTKLKARDPATRERKDDRQES